MTLNLVSTKPGAAHTSTALLDEFLIEVHPLVSRGLLTALQCEAYWYFLRFGRSRSVVGARSHDDPHLGYFLGHGSNPI